MKKIILLLLFTLTTISCSTNDNKELISEEPTIYGKWYFSETTPCGKNSIELNENSTMVENHYNSNCNIEKYYSTYTYSNNIITIYDTPKFVVELTNNDMLLYDENTNTYSYYSRE
jgi:hypothetical protein